MKRLLDIAIAVFFLIVFLLPMLCISLAIKATSPGPVLHWSMRIGRRNRRFHMPKFRTMRCDTPQCATHLLTNREWWVTPIGKVLRKTSLDELPQLWCILFGRMSFVGPRPALFNQHDLIELRTKKGVHVLAPGLTGWAQINGRDELSIEEKAEFDAYYLEHGAIWLDLKIIILTVVQVLRGNGIKEVNRPAPQAVDDQSEVA